MIIFEGSSRKEMIFNIKTKLAMIFFDTALLIESFKKDMIVTSMIRPKMEDSGIHSTGNAFDISIRNLTLKEQNYIVEYLNSKYIYDPLRPKFKTAILNDGRSYNGVIANHIHIQVHGD